MEPRRIAITNLHRGQRVRVTFEGTVRDPWVQGRWKPELDYGHLVPQSAEFTLLDDSQAEPHRCRDCGLPYVGGSIEPSAIRSLVVYTLVCADGHESMPLHTGPEEAEYEVSLAQRTSAVRAS